MRVPGWKRVRHLARWLDGYVRGRLLVLGYHRVASVDDDPYTLAVDPQIFASQIEVLTRRAHVVPLSEGVRSALEGRLPPGAVALTFDDGYADVYTHALPILERHGAPFAVFVATGNLGGEFWWDELARRVRAAYPPDPEGSATRDLRRESEAHSQLGMEIQRLQDEFSRMPGERRNEAIRALGRGSAAPDSAPATAMEAWQIRAIREAGLGEVGAHTVTHPRLSAIPHADRSEELRRSRKDLEEILGEPVVAFSYPHGDHDRETVESVRTAGFTLGCTSTAGLVSRSCDPLTCPRLWVGNWSADRFETWLGRWLPRSAT